MNINFTKTNVIGAGYVCDLIQAISHWSLSLNEVRATYSSKIPMESHDYKNH
jgi:hypothetical protein